MPTMSIHVSDEVLHEVETLAGQLDRSRSWVVGEALEPFLEHHRWVTERAEKALADMRDGKVKGVPHDAAVAEIMAYAATKV